MDEQNFKARLKELENRISQAKEKMTFNKRFHDGHELTYQEIVKHHQQVMDKIEDDLQSYEKKTGHLNTLEEQVILFLDSLDE